MLRTPLHQFHLDHQAHMVDFAGWDMPMTYSWKTADGRSGLIEEHKQVRSSGGLFDVSHMGRVKITGVGARRMLERMCTRKISDMEPGQCRYSLVCNEKGGVRDDVIVYRIDDDEFLVVVNASNREKLLAHMESVRSSGDFKAKIDDQTMSTAMVALQGPKVMTLIKKFSQEVPALKRYRFAVKNLIIAKIIVSRTGYTGEDGVEAILPSGSVGLALKFLLQDNDMSKTDALLKPAGLGCRDTLRTEAGMPLYGHELGEEINALSCGVDFAIALDKDGFIGQDVLKQTAAAGGPARKLAGIVIDGKRSARPGMVIKSGGREVGIVTSACPSPTLGVCIAMGFLDKDLHAVGTAVEIDTGKGTLAGKVAGLPFYKAPKPS